MKKYLSIDPRIRAKANDLIDQPVLIKVTKFNEESVDKFCEQMSLAHQVSQPIIPILIDSYGGSVDSLVSMISEIDNAQVPVATIIEGKAMSAGSVLFSCGTKGYRYMGENARIMIHGVSSMTGGKAEDMRADADETERLNQLLFHRMATNCGKDPDYFLELIHDGGNADWYMTSKEAKKHGLTDYIGVPQLKVSVSVTYDFGVPQKKKKES